MANNNNNKRSHLPNDNDDRETTSTRKYGICRCLGRLVPVVKFVSRENVCSKVFLFEFITLMHLERPADKAAILQYTL